ncbi:junction-mediating and -regulatory protein isoform X2 [Camelus dromedarius]|uniref:junction-mediating and -regulatory protein isoform X2 n=1 Tax=Camelus dromedarius TaxID=9838 RepID=UPI003119C09A
MAQRQRSGTSGQVYLGHDLDTCGWKILSQEFFTETHDWEYYEPLASCSRRTRKRIQEIFLNGNFYTSSSTIPLTASLSTHMHKRLHPRTR